MSARPSSLHSSDTTHAINNLAPAGTTDQPSCCSQHLHARRGRVRITALTSKSSSKGLNDLFHDRRTWQRCQKWPKAAQSSELKAAFEKHGQTKEHVARFEQVFDVISKKPVARTCAAIMGITDEGGEIMEEYKGATALCGTGRRNYEISCYGILRTWASELGLTEAVNLLDLTLGEEKETDAAPTELVESAVNVAGGRIVQSEKTVGTRTLEISPWKRLSTGWLKRSLTPPAGLGPLHFA
ncbi:YciE/YciF ferroxidase family protein [Mesorhizobium silamurunense]|uniref:YciE/YciF ferroxidase family protein n=1 Tax=Mesorhizobium silamurunense TaxID=499528 RepID=UPI0028AFF336|nr:DUF892 family protein [Mesorhizobium silamurunense]